MSISVPLDTPTVKTAFKLSDAVRSAEFSSQFFTGANVALDEVSRQDCDPGQNGDYPQFSLGLWCNAICFGDKSDEKRRYKYTADYFFHLVSIRLSEEVL